MNKFFLTVTLGVGLSLAVGGNAFADESDGYIEGVSIVNFDAPEIPYQGSTVWTVDATSDTGNKLKYQWYYDDKGTFWDDELSRTPLVGETSNTLKIDFSENMHKAYYVVVDDGVCPNVTGTRAIIDSGLLAYFDESYETYAMYRMEEGDSKTFTVVAETPLDKPITYQWQQRNRENWELEDIKGANAKSYTVTKPGEYNCFITDGYGERELGVYAYFQSVFLDGMDNAEITEDEYGYTAKVYLKKGEKKTVKVKAHSTESSDLFYSWSVEKLEYDEDGYPFISFDDLDIDAPVCTIDSFGKYSCIVSDYNSDIRIEIEVVPDAKTEIICNTTEFSAKVGEKLNIEFEVKNPDNADIKYIWKRYDNGESIVAETKVPKLTVNADINAASYYCCEVVVEGVTIEYLPFYVFVEGIVDEIDGGEGFFTQLGQKLEVKLDSKYSSYATYQWYYCNENDGLGEIFMIEGANKSSYTVPKKESDVRNCYYCEVSVGSYYNSFKYSNKLWKFTDVLDGKYYTEAVRFLYNRNIMTGYNDTTFGVDNLLKREEVVTLFWKAQGKPEVEMASSFKDIPDGKYYTEAVKWAKEFGVVTGYTSGEHAGEFGRGNYITRQDFVKILYKYAEVFGADTSVDRKNAYLEKADGKQVSGYAAEAMNWGYLNGFIGNNSDLLPKDNITRKQAATILARFFQKYPLYVF